MHPISRNEFAIDIVQPSANLTLSTAECLAQVAEILDTLAARHFSRKTRFILRVNHMTLLRAALLQCGVPRDAMDATITWLSVERNGERKCAF